MKERPKKTFEENYNIWSNWPWLVVLAALAVGVVFFTHDWHKPKPDTPPNEEDYPLVELVPAELPKLLQSEVPKASDEELDDKMYKASEILGKYCNPLFYEDITQVLALMRKVVDAGEFSAQDRAQLMRLTGGEDVASKIVQQVVTYESLNDLKRGLRFNDFWDDDYYYPESSLYQAFIDDVLYGFGFVNGDELADYEKHSQAHEKKEVFELNKRERQDRRYWIIKNSYRSAAKAWKAFLIDTLPEDYEQLQGKFNELYNLSMGSE